ncbi:hypothetical protein G9A89_012123 [Geosiphon pyriformis]|nr:hypothetical protein G9A89_012123 [Geosiphon pyriformis]
MLPDVCEKWDKLLRKGLKLKANLPKDFSNEALYHPELYNLKLFSHLQAKCLLANLVNFINLKGVLGRLFEHRAMNLQAISWMSQQPLSFPVILSIDPTNCFLAGVIDIGSLYDFGFTNEHLAQSEFGIINIYTDGSVKNLGSVGACGSAAAYFLCANLDVGVRVYGLLSLTLVELQAIAFTLNCISALSSVVLHTDSQASLNICASLDCSINPNFHKKCWIKKKHICFAVASKNLSVAWVKVKSHSGIVGNEHADFFADVATNSNFVLPIGMIHRFLAIEGRPVSGNACHFDSNAKKELISNMVSSWTDVLGTSYAGFSVV